MLIRAHAGEHARRAHARHGHARFVWNLHYEIIIIILDNELLSVFNLEIKLKL